MILSQGNVGDYFVFRSPTYSNWLILRAFLDAEGKPDQAIANYENGLRLYPYSQKDNPPQMKFIKAGEKIFNTVMLIILSFSTSSTL
jgi:hypothetical protein